MILARTLQDISREEGKNWRTIKKIAILVEKKNKMGKIVKVGYVMPNDILNINKKTDGET